MKQLLLVYVALFLFSCNDGNQDVPDFDFSKIKANSCGKLVLYTVKDHEAVAINLNNVSTDLFTTATVTDLEYTLTDSGSNTFTYRTFDSSPTDYFCHDIPPVSPQVLGEWTGSGDLFITVALNSKDDMDGYSVSQEETDSQGNSDIDGDGIDNYFDNDDDNDGILTKNEKKEDTDGDGYPNYMDSDDDGDGIPTRNESDLVNPDGTIDYLNKESIVQMTEPRALQPNIYTEEYRSTFRIKLLELTNQKGDIMRYDVFDGFGYLTESKNDTVLINQ